MGGGVSHAWALLEVVRESRGWEASDLSQAQGGPWGGGKATYSLGRGREEAIRRLWRGSVRCKGWEQAVADPGEGSV